jgi:RNA polymerase-binding transcription factor DksA
MSDSNAKTRARLEARLASLQGRLAEINETLREPQDDDFEEQAAELDDDAVLEHLSHAGKIEAYLIEAALTRIDEGNYGKCVECGKAIAKRRLQALPEAERCLPCAEQCGNR